MIYGRLVDIVVLVLLPAVALFFNSGEAESSEAEDSTSACEFFTSASLTDSSPSSAAADFVSHALIQTDSELHYFRDSSQPDLLFTKISEFSEEQHRKSDIKKIQKHTSIFENEETDFGKLSVGLPVSRKIIVFNPTSSKLILTAISSPPESIHCSFFADRILEPKQKTNFTVFMLPARNGTIMDIITVYTNIGKFTHKVVGNVISNPYRLRSFLNLKLPLNASLVSTLEMHNPHSGMAAISEIFSSDPNVRVELSGSTTSRSNIAIKLEIAPIETREIAKLRLIGDIERNTTSFICVRFRIRQFLDISLDEKDNVEKIIIIPINMQMTSRPNIFSTDNIFDFGMIRHGERSRQLSFHIYSNIEKGVDIESIYAVGEHNRAHGIYVQFAAKPPLSVKCSLRNHPGAPIQIAKLTISSALGANDDAIMIDEKLYRKRGVIVAESRGGNYNVTVPYEALIYKGNLTHHIKQLAFHYNERSMTIHDVVLTNNFSLDIVIFNVSLPDKAKDIFEAQLMKPIIMLKPGKSIPALSIKYKRQQNDIFYSHLTLHTNLTDFKLPLFVFRGRLNVRLSSPNEKYIDFGELAPGEHRSMLMHLENSNPIPITIEIPKRPWSLFTNIYLRDCHEKNCTVGKSLVLPANNTLTLNISLFGSPNSILFNTQHPFLNGTERKDDLIFRTKFEEFKFQVKFRPVRANIVAVDGAIKFENCFVGTISSQPLMIYSSYAMDLPVSRISLLENDPRFFFSKIINSTIHANSVTALARINFLPEAICALNPNLDECYTGILLDSTDGQWFTYGLKLPQNLAEIDSYLYGRLRRRWAKLSSKTINATVIIDTPRVKNFEVPVIAHMKWPRLLSHSVVRFPLTAVGNFTIVNLTLSNPSTRPIVVQLLPLVIYPDAESMLEYFRGEFPVPLIEPIEMNETLMFSLRDTELFTLRKDSPVPKLREELEEIVGTQVPRFTLSMLLRPGMKTRIRLGFLPSDYVLRSSLLLVRNNLTGIEPIVLYGQGAQIRMEIENRTARNGAPLLFDIQPTHLADCRNPRRLLHKLSSTLTVKRSFTVRNTGEVPFSVVNISINNHPCENRGFRILNCAPFCLAPNEFIVLDVAYTPDFLMTRNDASLQLYMHMNGTPWVFGMCAQVPRHMLSTCHSALPRPSFEGVMYYTCVFALLLCLICVLACSYLEGDRIVSCAIRQLFFCTTERRVFDLNSVTNRTESAIKYRVLENRTQPNTYLHWLKARFFILKPIRYRDYFIESSDSRRAVRMLQRIANHILWFFSHFWLFLRGGDDVDQQNSIINRKNRRKKSPLQCDSQRNEHLDTTKEKSFSVRQNEKEERRITSYFCVSLEQANHNDDKTIINELRQRKKLNVDESVISNYVTSKIDLHNSNNSKAEKQNEIHCEISNESSNINNEKTKKKNKKKSRKNAEEMIQPKQATNFSQSSSKIINPLCDLDYPSIRGEESIRIQRSNLDELSLNTIDPPPGFENIRPTLSPADSTSTTSSSTSFVNLDAGEFTQPTYVNTFKIENIDEKKRITSGDKCHSILKIKEHNKILRKRFDDDSDDEADESEAYAYADTSSAPEWADSIPLNVNVDEDFNTLSLNTALLRFDEQSSAMDLLSPISSASHSSFAMEGIKRSFQRTPRRPINRKKDEIIDTQHRQKKSKIEDPEIEKYIGRMTRDYRERLKRAIANGMTIEEAEGHASLKLKLPDDFTTYPNIRSDDSEDLLAYVNCKDINTSSLSPQLALNSIKNNNKKGNETLDSVSRSTANQNVGVIGDNVANSRTTITHNDVNDAELEQKYFRNTASIWGPLSPFELSASNNCSDQDMPTSSMHAALLSHGTECFLFAESDPIWKPIFEEQNSVGIWPNEFNFNSISSNNNLFNIINDNANKNNNTNSNINVCNIVDNKAKNE